MERTLRKVFLRNRFWIDTRAKGESSRVQDRRAWSHPGLLTNDTLSPTSETGETFFIPVLLTEDTLSIRHPVNAQTQREK